VHALVSHGYTPVIYDSLSSGHRAFAQGVPLIEGDIRDEGKLRSALRGADAVLHFAANIDVGESVRDPGKYFDNNVSGSLALLRAATDLDVKYFIFSSSAAVYGTPDRTPIREDAPIRPINPYGLSKAFVEQALEAFGKATALRYVSLRYFNAAGADNSGTLAELHVPETHLIPSLLLTAARLRDCARIYGTDYPTPDGTCIRDYVHVSDLADAHVLALEYLLRGGESTALNIGLGEGHSVMEIVAEVERVTGRTLPKEVSPRRPGDPAVLVADSSRARTLLGWAPSRGLPEMVSTAWAALQKHRLPPERSSSAQVIEMVPLSQQKRHTKTSG
jgi:UDP-glucose-4-epimerase GalE